MSDTEIWNIVDAWIIDLSHNDFVSAFQRTGHVKRQSWTPELLRQVIEGYGLPERHPSGQVFRITDPESAAGEISERSIDRFRVSDADIVGEVRCSLPLNGIWSDLTATFQLIAVEHSETLLLNEIHVF